jgi:hypothetical protein
VKISLNGQPSPRSASPMSISLLRRACQIRALRRWEGARNRMISRTVSRRMPSGASVPNQPALIKRARRGATMRLVAVTPE